MRVAIVDDDQLVTLALKTILEVELDIEVVAMGRNGLEAVEIYEKEKPQILLMDIRMEAMTGLEAAEVILRKDHSANILFLTTFLDDEYIIRAIRMGAKGYLLKQRFDCIVPALRTVSLGHSVYGDDIIRKVPDMMQMKEVFDGKKYGLSDKEVEIMEQVSLGLSNKEIADTLFLSEGTVRNYISLILDKLELRDRTQLAICYYRGGKLHG